MSSRALRRLQRDSGIGLSPGDLPAGEVEDLAETNPEAEASGVAAGTRPKSKKKGKRGTAPLNPFELLTNGQEEESNQSDQEEVNTDASEENTPEVVVKAAPKSKKKKKSRKKGLENNTTPKVEDQKEAEDEVEASVQEVNRILGEANVAVIQSDGGENTKAANMKSLLHIDHRNLNPETELKRMFGSQVVRGEQQQERHRRQRNRPLQRSSRLVQPKDNWHPTGGSGISMKYLGEQEGFTFEHSPAYQRQQFDFYDAVESGHPEAIVNILQKHPYHIDALVQMSDFHRMNEDFQTAAEFIEKAMYGMECAFHPMFNIAAGNCHLPFNRPENRPFYMCIFKHILNMGRRGCNRTAFEFCKLLLSLDPSDDPLDCMSMIDFYALRSEQYEYLLRLEAEALTSDASRQVPNFAFSIPLAHFKDALKKGCDTGVADKKLQEALILFPVMLIPLLDQCSVHPDKRVSTHPFFNSKELLDDSSELGRLVRLYVKRCESCWKEPDVMAWLERNVQAVLDIVDSGANKRVQEYAELRRVGFRKPPLSLLRHYFLSEIQGVSPPQRFTSGSLLSYDPFPPPRSIVSYTRPSRDTSSQTGDHSIIRSFLESIHPRYNPQEPMREDDPGPGGAAARNIANSVAELMNAMRQLLNDPLARAHGAAEDQEGDGDGEPDNEGEWEEGEEGQR